MIQQRQLCLIPQHNIRQKGALSTHQHGKAPVKSGGAEELTRCAGERRSLAAVQDGEIYKLAYILRMRVVHGAKAHTLLKLLLLRSHSMSSACQPSLTCSAASNAVEFCIKSFQWLVYVIVYPRLSRPKPWISAHPRSTQQTPTWLAPHRCRDRFYSCFRNTLCCCYLVRCTESLKKPHAASQLPQVSCAPPRRCAVSHVRELQTARRLDYGASSAFCHDKQWGAV